jgi:hypothetical protein
VCAIKETHFLPSIAFNLCNFVTYHQNLIDARGGDGTILVKRSIQHRSISPPALQSLGAEGISLCMVYRGPHLLSSLQTPWKLQPPLREGSIAAESNEDKATHFANLLATQKVPAAHLTANDAFQLLGFLLPEVYGTLKLVNAGEVQAIVRTLLKRNVPGPDGITNVLLKKMPLTGSVIRKALSVPISKICGEP